MTTITPPSYVTQSEEQYDKRFDPRIARRMADFIRPYNGRVVIAMLFMAGASAASVAGPYFVKVALDSGLTAKNIDILRQTVLAFVAVSIIQWVCTYFRVRLMAYVSQSVIYDLRKSLFEHLQKLSLSFYSRYSVGRVITRVINDVEVLRDFLTWGMLAIVRDVFVLVGIIIAMLGMNLRLSLITFTVLPLMALATYIFRRAARHSYRKVRAAMSWVNSVLAENINAVRVVQAFSRQKTNYEHFSGYTNRYHLQMSLNAAKISTVYYPVVDILGAIATALVIWVGAHEFIVNLKAGYDTIVQEGGVLLSVGQRQLISFARALLADPRILILDEATSSVDTQTEQIIQKALLRLLQGRTSFVIAHRLSTITNADLIVVVHDGRIIEKGTHTELLGRKGYYFELYRTGFQD